MNKFHEIKDPACLKKFSMSELERIERSVYTLKRRAFNNYMVSKQGCSTDYQIACMDVLHANSEIWTKVRTELEKRVEGILDLEAFMNIPVSTDYIIQGQG